MTRLRIVLLSAMLATNAAAQTPVPRQTMARDVLAACSAGLDPRPEPGAEIQRGLCGGYLIGFAAGYDQANTSGPPLWCPPAKRRPSLEQMARAFTLYMQQHPEQLQEGLGAVIPPALRSAWPCPST